jgi:integrase
VKKLAGGKWPRNIPHQPITSQLQIRAYPKGQGNQRMKRLFLEYLAIFDPRTEALDPKAFPRNRAIPPPRLLTDDELVRLMAACRAVSPNCPECSRFLTPIVGLLASTGMRSGEALLLLLLPR